jgi:hypothetical protein
MVDKKEKQIIVEQIMVTGYVKHSNGRKTMFEFMKNDFEPKSLTGIFQELGRKYE